jgi:hypothetical protein
MVSELINEKGLKINSVFLIVVSEKFIMGCPNASENLKNKRAKNPNFKNIFFGIENLMSMQKLLLLLILH